MPAHWAERAMGRTAVRQTLREVPRRAGDAGQPVRAGRRGCGSPAASSPPGTALLLELDRAEPFPDAPTGGEDSGVLEEREPHPGLAAKTRPRTDRILTSIHRFRPALPKGAQLLMSRWLKRCTPRPNSSPEAATSTSVSLHWKPCRSGSPPMK